MMDWLGTSRGLCIFPRKASFNKERGQQVAPVAYECAYKRVTRVRRRCFVRLPVRSRGTFYVVAYFKGDCLAGAEMDTVFFRDGRVWKDFNNCVRG